MARVQLAPGTRRGHRGRVQVGGEMPLAGRAAAFGGFALSVGFAAAIVLGLIP